MSKILVIEDDQISRKLLMKTLEKMGHAVLQASTGVRGLHALQDNPDVAMIVTDLMLPELSGQELVRTIRGNSSWLNLPILMVSGVIQLKEIVHILELGASRFLPKPVNVSDLKAYVSSCLSPKEMDRTLTEEAELSREVEI
ncbi:MAG: response regulator [Oligoflexia bacterium]|nr:response regulator [Oligoflexia bacterium]